MKGIHAFSALTTIGLASSGL